jgi:sulfite reductase (NADPH) flavoprotein alpha-component
VVCSTFGDGEFPDDAVLFWEALSAEDAPRLENLSFAVLALGDVSYEFFCNAGKLLDGRLEALGATRLTERVDVDGAYEQPAGAWTTDLVKLLQDSRNRLLTAPESDREVRHYELDLTCHAFDYCAGIPSPCTRRTTRRSSTRSWRTSASTTVTPSRALQSLVEANWPVEGRDILDLLRLTGLTIDELLDTLRPLQSRDYSIASSPLVHPDQVHLTVATVRYDSADHRHGGAASTFLADRGDAVSVHLRPNHTFRLPAADVPIVMIGPGTGIAPFRAFLQERRATDFLYGDELQDFVASGTLTRLDLAFSRDRLGGPKQYVQQRMWETSAELFGWLQDGAHVYVCGDEKRMARDVDETLRRIVEAKGDLDAESAHAYVNDLVRTHRYVRDVY